MKKLINIHTHLSGEATCITNLSHTDNITPDKSGYFSIGLHPMHAAEFAPEIIALLDEKIASNKNIIAIGEVGLDRLCHVYLSTQMQAFSEQLKLAEKHNLPCIIHNVRCTDEILKLYKKSGISQPLVFHGFRGKVAVAEQILSAGGYLSFGRAITTKDEATIASFVKTPLDKLFLETDDATDVTIEDVYRDAAALKQISVEELISEISTNFARLFKERE